MSRGRAVEERPRIAPPADFAEARRIIGGGDEELASALGVATERVREWSAGAAKVPRKHEAMAIWLAAAEQRQAALRESGLPECEWLRTHEEQWPDDDPDALQKHIEATERHVESCATCRARDRFVDERFGPMPEPPTDGWMRLFAWIDRVPAWGRPAAMGALFIGAIVSIRVLAALPWIFSQPAKLGGALLAVVAGAAAGAVGGFAYSLTRPVLRRLGRPGDYLSGIVCVFAYMGALIFAAPVAFGETLVEDRAGLVVFAVVSVFFGLVVGHTWFRKS